MLAPCHSQIIAHREACGKARGVPQDHLPTPEPTETGVTKCMCCYRRIPAVCRRAAGADGGVAMTEHAVVIAGGGPTGLMLAAELALAGVDVAIVERRASQELIGSRAGGLHSRTIEVLDQRGVAERFLSQGQVHKVVHFHVPLDISDFPTRHNYVLGLWQNHIERILADWVGELAVPIYRAREVTGFTQDDAGVDVELSDGQSRKVGVSRRVRRRTQSDPQSSRHRVPRVGRDGELADRRGGDVRGAGMGLSPRRRRYPCDRQGGRRGAGAGGADRTTDRIRRANPPCAISVKR